MQAITPFDKAIVGGILAAITAEAARYGWRPSGQAVSLISVILTAAVPYVLAHAAVYFKANKGV